MKKIFWSGLILALAFLIIGWLIKGAVWGMVLIWKDIYYLINPLGESSLAGWLNPVLLFVFSIICSLLIIIIAGLLFSIKIKGQSFADILLKCFSRIPGIRSIFKLIHQITEGSQSFNKKELRLAIYKSADGERKLGVIRPREIELNYQDGKEKVIPFYQAITPYAFSGIPSLIRAENLYEITNFSFEDYIKYITTGGLFFKLPKKIKLKKLSDNQQSAE